jgi:hypothetical protein
VTDAGDVEREDVIAGEMTDCMEPEWAPLVNLIGLELVEWFMWMFAVALEDGSTLQAYKHVTTRRYFHLAEDGRAFAYTARGSYREINRHDAICGAFSGCWDSPSLSQDEASAVRAELARVLGAVA